MSASIRSQSFYNPSAATSSHQVSLPAGAAAGDVLIVFGVWAANPGAPTITAQQTGWTQLWQQEVTNNAASEFTVYCAKRIAGSSEPAAYGFTSSVSDRAGALMLAVKGATDVDTLAGGGTAAANSLATTAPSATYTTPTITPASSGDLILALMGGYISSAGLSWTPDAAFSEYSDQIAVNGCSVEVETLLQAAAAAVHATATGSSSGSFPSAGIVAVKSAPLPVAQTAAMPAEALEGLDEPSSGSAAFAPILEDFLGDPLEFETGLGQGYDDLTLPELTVPAPNVIVATSAPVAQSAHASVDTLTAVTAAASDPFESLAETVASAATAAEPQQALTGRVLLNIAFQRQLMQDADLQLEAQMAAIPVSQTALVPVEAVQLLAPAGLLPADSLSLLNAASTVPLELLGGGITAAALVSLSFLRGLADSDALPVDALGLFTPALFLLVGPAESGWAAEGGATGWLLGSAALFGWTLGAAELDWEPDSSDAGWQAGAAE